jgi:hypothetical protein
MNGEDLFNAGKKAGKHTGDAGRPVFSRGQKKGEDAYEDGRDAGTTSSI